MIIVEPCAGLGNRFLGMASAYHWAKQTGDELTVLWKTERVMGARNEAVFSLPEEIKIIHAKDFGYKDKPFSHLRYQLLEKSLRKKADYFSDVDTTNDLFLEKGNAYYEKVIKDNKLKFIRAFSQFHDFNGIDRPLEVQQMSVMYSIFSRFLRLIQVERPEADFTALILTSMTRNLPT
jgi:hypothetical protein